MMDDHLILVYSAEITWGAAREKCDKKYKSMFKKLVCNAHTVDSKVVYLDKGK